MSDRPKIHFIQGGTTEDCEKSVNAWIDSLPFVCTILNISVMPMMYNGNMVFMAVVTYTGVPSYMQSTGGSPA